jgi:hypothetical protein
MANSVLSVNTNGSQAIIPINDKIAIPVLANATTTTETVVAKWQLPANFLKAGIGINAYTSFLSGGTGTVIWRLRIGTAGTITDPLACQLTTSAAQVLNSRGGANFSIYASNTTTLNASGFSIMQNSILGQITAAITNLTVVPTATIFISITEQVSVASACITPGASLTVPVY